MTTSLSFGGLASGLDTTAIINALVGAEAIPITLEEGKQATEEAKLSLMSNFEGLVKTLQDKADEMKSISTFLSHIVTPSTEGYANFTVTGAPTAGSHTLEVLALAAAEKWGSNGFADPDTTQLDGGSISFDYGGTAYSVVVDPASSTLNDIASAINAQAGDAVSATVINTGTDLSPSYELVMTGKDTGEDFALENMNVTGFGNGPLDFGSSPLVAASNASLVVDGLTVERSDNDFSGVVPGITIDAIAVTNTPITFGVTVDQDAVKEKMKEFIDAYNAVSSFIQVQSRFSEDDGAEGELFGDKILQTVNSKLYSGFIAADPSAVIADTEGYSAISLLGLEIDQNGNLTMDEEEFGEKLSGNIELFADFFGNETTGAFAKLSGELDYLLDSTGTDFNGDPLDGLFAIRKEGLNSKISDFKDRIEDMNYRLDKFEGALVTKYAALEVLMAKLQVQGNAVDNLSSLGLSS
ncbi:MAG: flagellar filament capping protein FliD [Planctomycetota bacterium]|nr:flagellar filament capping protein FliD [Planctomycetota bacterium]MDG2143214.1 flagellar filament capping protein FliD [Planctomycetota bacterium]